ncbi:MAG: DUF4065 domain-containing protein [Proteobacteria bacterium]|nr:DUF4065 domain-containing protein [Pseudomonadota bacterium]
MSGVRQDLSQIAKYMCKYGEDNALLISNLKLQKLMYLGQMKHLSECEGAGLFHGVFYAWQHGPVLIDLYNALDIYGSLKIPSEEFKVEIQLPDAVEKFVDGVMDDYAHYDAWTLVNATHQKGGAWDKVFKPNQWRRQISEVDMRAEFDRGLII